MIQSFLLGLGLGLTLNLSVFLKLGDCVIDSQKRTLDTLQDLWNKGNKGKVRLVGTNEKGRSCHQPSPFKGVFRQRARFPLPLSQAVPIAGAYPSEAVSFVLQVVVRSRVSLA